METWKVSLLCPKYEVSNAGRIRNKKTKRIKKCQLGAGGYLYTTLQLPNHKQRPCLVHLLIANEWIEGKSERDNTVHHKDDNKTNNTLGNLCWVPHSDNDKLIYDDGRKRAKISFIEAEEIRSAYSAGVSNSLLAQAYNVSRSTISDIIKGRTHQDADTYKR